MDETKLIVTEEITNVLVSLDDENNIAIEINTEDSVVTINEEVTNVTVNENDNTNLEIKEEITEVIEVGIPTSSTPVINDGTYIHDQSLPLKIWNIKHNLNKYPSVTIVDSADSVVMGDIEYISVSELNVSFTSQFSGKAYLN